MSGVTNELKVRICSSKKYPYPPRERSFQTGSGVVLQTSTFLKESKKLNWNFHQGGSLLCSRFWDVTHADIPKKRLPGWGLGGGGHAKIFYEQGIDIWLY